MRNCYLVGLNDLAGGQDYVQEKIAGYLQVLVNAMHIFHDATGEV